MMQQHLDFRTLQDHRIGHTTSDLLYKGVLTDEAQSVFSGLIRVHQGAQHTDAYQANRNLLLSDQARAHSIPNSGDRGERGALHAWGYRRTGAA
jgi:Fe-S cluster assembly protein SufD